MLDREAIANAFRRLGERLVRRGLTADVYVIGGAAMAMAYDARRATRDIDAVFRPHGAVIEEAWAVADELGLPRWWLNDQASAYVARGGDNQAPRVFEHPGLRVSAASPRHLLAMKVLAAGDGTWRTSGSSSAGSGSRVSMTSSRSAPRSSRRNRCRNARGWCSRTLSRTRFVTARDVDVLPRPNPVEFRFNV